MTTPKKAIEPLQTAAAQSRSHGDLDSELAAIAQLARLNWWRQDLAPLGIQLALRVFDLEATGHPTAQALAAFGRAIAADLTGDDSSVLDQLARIPQGTLDARWEAMADWLRGVDAATEIVERSTLRRPLGRNCIYDALQLRTRWALGHVDDVLHETPRVLAALSAAGVIPNLYVGLTNASVVLSHTGHTSEARHCLDEAEF